MANDRYKELIDAAQAAQRQIGPTRAERILSGSVEDALCAVTSWPRLSAMPEPVPMARPKPKAKGRCRPTRNEKGQNKLEAAYDDHLRRLVADDQIMEYWWDALTLKIGNDCRYRTDFLVQCNDGALEIHETKGHMEDDALVKLKVVANQFPFIVLIVKKTAQGWNLTEVRR